MVCSMANLGVEFQSSFELTGYITLSLVDEDKWSSSFKALSSLQVI